MNDNKSTIIIFKQHPDAINFLINPSIIAGSEFMKNPRGSAMNTRIRSIGKITPMEPTQAPKSILDMTNTTFGRKKKPSIAPPIAPLKKATLQNKRERRKEYAAFISLTIAFANVPKRKLTSIPSRIPPRPNKLPGRKKDPRKAPTKLTVRMPAIHHLLMGVENDPKGFEKNCSNSLFL